MTQFSTIPYLLYIVFGCLLNFKQIQDVAMKITSNILHFGYSHSKYQYQVFNKVLEKILSFKTDYPHDEFPQTVLFDLFKPIHIF